MFAFLEGRGGRAVGGEAVFASLPARLRLWPGGHFRRYSHTKPVLSSCMNSVRRWYALLYSSAAFARAFSSPPAWPSAEDAALTPPRHFANFVLNSSGLTPFTGEMRVTLSPTRRSSLPSPFTSATHTRVARTGPVRSPSLRGWPYSTLGPGLISGWNGMHSGALPLPALFS